MKVVDCGVLIDGIADEPIRDARILIEDERISDVGPREDITAPSTAEHIEFSDESVTPGFIEGHMHLNGTRSFASIAERVTTDVPLRTARAIDDLQSLLKVGYTTVRDVGSIPGPDLQEAVAEGTVDGPRVFSAGRPYSQTAGHVDIHSLPYEWVTGDHSMGILADGADECRKKARMQLREGVDMLKIMTTGGLSSEKDDPEHAHYTAAEVQAFTEEAHRFGLPVTTHAEGATGIKLALENGVDVIEHGIGIDEEGVELAKETDATIVPTLAAIYTMAEEGEEYEIPPHAIEKAQRVVGEHATSIQRAYEAGVPIALGADFDGSAIHSHGHRNTMEFELLVEQVGMTEMETIKAATSVAARTVPADDIGAIEPGNHADLVVLGENPLDDISAVRDSVVTVYKDGAPVN